MNRLFPGALAALAVLAGCGASAEPVETPPAAPARPALAPLPMLVPEGARAIVVAEPAALMAAPAVSSVVGDVVPDGLIDAFERRTGVDPTALSELVIAEFDRGFVLFARGTFPAADVVRAAEIRMNTVEATQDEPFVRRLGFLGSDLRDVVAIDEHVVMVAGGVPDVVSAVLIHAEQGAWPEGRRSALAGPEVAPLVERLGAGPLVIYGPHPLQLPEGFGASLLLARQRSLAAAVLPEDDATLGIEVALRGEFPEGAEQNFRAMVESMGRSPLGAALGISEAARTLSVQVDDDSVVLRARVASSALATGLRVLFVAQLEELLSGAPSAP